MSQPWGFTHRNDRTLRGLLARWWYERRRKVIAEQLRKRR